MLGADADELQLGEKVSDQIRRRMVQRPNTSRNFAAFDDETLDRLVAQIEE